jgi:hypothetical protein
MSRPIVPRGDAPLADERADRSRAEWRAAAELLPALDAELRGLAAARPGCGQGGRGERRAREDRRDARTGSHHGALPVSARAIRSWLAGERKIGPMVAKRILGLAESGRRSEVE